MQLLSTLELGLRLAVGFGAVAAGLAIVAAVATLAMQGLRDDTRTLAGRNLAATADLGALA